MQQPKILIVEDEFIVAHDMKARLFSRGYEKSEIVKSGEEAVDKVSDCNFDLILMDIKLKGEIDGIEAASKIKEKSNVPIVYASGNSDLFESDRLKVTNPAGILHKPITDGMFFDVVEPILKH